MPTVSTLFTSIYEHLTAGPRFEYPTVGTFEERLVLVRRLGGDVDLRQVASTAASAQGLTFEEKVGQEVDAWLGRCMDFGNVKQLVIGFRGTFDEDIAMLDWRSAEGFILVEYYNCADAMHAESDGHMHEDLHDSNTEWYRETVPQCMGLPEGTLLPGWTTDLPLFNQLVVGHARASYVARFPSAVSFVTPPPGERGVTERDTQTLPYSAETETAPRARLITPMAMPQLE